MEMTLVYWRDDVDGPGSRLETLEQHFRELDWELIPEFQDDTLKLSLNVVDGPDDLEEWVTLYFEFDTVAEFYRSISTLSDDLVRMMDFSNKEEAPSLLAEG